jgi:spermidine/putrescine transport system ATP-binding protein
MPVADAAIDPGRRYTGILRPEHVEIIETADLPGASGTPGAPDTAAGQGLSVDRGFVEDVIEVGSHTLVTVRVGELLLACRRLGMAGRGLGRGAPVLVGYRPEHLHVIDEPAAPDAPGRAPDGRAAA